MREGAVSLKCDSAKMLTVRIEPEGKSAWIIFPEREFRLDRVDDAGAVRYSNGRTTLLVKGGQMSVEEGGAASFAECKPS